MRTAVIAIALAASGAAGVKGQTVTFSGQVRPRTEVRVSEPRSDGMTTMRTRLDARAALSPTVSVLLQAQDVRLWGEETSTTANANRIEMHQAFIDFAKAGGALRIGRQEASYGEERLLGASDWQQQGRAFDGVRGRITHAKLVVDGFVHQVGDVADATKSSNDRFMGSYATYAASKLVGADAYLLHNRSHGLTASRQTTSGIRVAGNSRALGYRVEAALQRGLRADTSVDAYMVTARATVNAVGNRAQLTLWYDYLSGDSDRTDASNDSFETLYGTNHKYYGIADLFTNIPSHTAGRGLQDIAVKTTFNASDVVTLNLDAHEFRAAAGDALLSDFFGNEVDVVAVYTYSPAVSMNGGAAYFRAGDGMAAIARPQPSQSFVYLMLNATF
jgi:hypothetical protein